ncbi:hypothetical protein LguiA_026398 [Lonicera macranthoides]
MGFLTLTGNLEVIEITDTHIRIKTFVSFNCYNRSGGLINRTSLSSELNRANFMNSELNKFILVGCDDLATIEGNLGRNFTSGCMSVCSDSQDVLSGSCSGSGCCQISIPKGLKGFEVELSSKRNHTEVSSFNLCGYAFLGEEKSFRFGGASDLSDPTFINRIEESVPRVLDWVIANNSCVDAKNSNDFACLQNSHCVDSDTGFAGYRCSCNQGFEGNPYLPSGCTDIDECMDPNNLCEKKCINTPGGYNCSCPDGFFGDGRKDGRGCIAKNSQSLVVKIILGMTTGFGMLFFILSTWWIYKLVRKRNILKLRQKFFKRNGGFLLQKQLTSGEEGNVEKTKLFTSKELEKATDRYNENRILGKGGQGTVYKGMLRDGKIVAVKKSTKVDEGQLDQFINEVVILSQINHRNVVRLHGCCLETEVPLLVYEFIPNGTLFQYIHYQNEDFPLTWDVRLRIAIEVATALSYLHCAASIPIYHRDIKSTNILLDDKYKAKVADFGTSRSIGVDQTHLTTRVLGTFGYLDPEYFQSGQFTEKSEVYSFAVVLVELLTGQKPISSIGSDEVQSLSTYFLQTMEENRIFDIIDERVRNESRKKEIIGVANLARRCLNLSRKKRPTIKEVAMELEAIKMSKGASTIQQHYEEVEYDINEFSESWETASTSTSTTNPFGAFLGARVGFGLQKNVLFVSR